MNDKAMAIVWNSLLVCLAIWAFAGFGWAQNLFVFWTGFIALLSILVLAAAFTCPEDMPSGSLPKETLYVVHTFLIVGSAALGWFWCASTWLWWVFVCWLLREKRKEALESKKEEKKEEEADV